MLYMSMTMITSATKQAVLHLKLRIQQRLKEKKHTAVINMNKRLGI